MKQLSWRIVELLLMEENNALCYNRGNVNRIL